MVARHYGCLTAAPRVDREPRAAVEVKQGVHLSIRGQQVRSRVWRRGAKAGQKIKNVGNPRGQGVAESFKTTLTAPYQCILTSLVWRCLFLAPSHTHPSTHSLPAAPLGLATVAIPRLDRLSNTLLPISFPSAPTRGPQHACFAFRNSCSLCASS